MSKTLFGELKGFHLKQHVPYFWNWILEKKKSISNRVHVKHSML